MRTETKRAAEMLAYYKRKIDKLEEASEADDPPVSIRSFDEGFSLSVSVSVETEGTDEAIWDVDSWDGPTKWGE